MRLLGSYSEGRPATLGRVQPADPLQGRVGPLPTGPALGTWPWERGGGGE